MSLTAAAVSSNASSRKPNAVTQSYTALAATVRQLDLQRRTPYFYALVFGLLMVGLGGTVTGFILLDDSWLQLLMAGALGVLLTQLAFMGHEASHRQVLTSGPANDRVGWFLAVVCVGISYSWWMNKHTRHHGNPNQLGKDPDIEVDTISFHVESAAEQRGFMAWLTRHQGLFFFPLLLLEGLNLHAKSVQSLVRDWRVAGRRLELAVLTVRFALYLGAVFWLLPLGMAFAFVGVQMAVFGLYMGAAFAPNHVGMPIIDRGVKLDFFTKQVRTSRNVSGGWWMTALMGGLNYQIEHHLFPSMPRPHLARARQLVREHCRTHGVAYAENNIVSAWRIVIDHLNTVGLSAGANFRCAVATQLR